MVIGIFDGLRDAYADLQQAHMEAVTGSQELRVALQRNQQETHQLLEAAEHLERQNNENKERAGAMEAEARAAQAQKSECERQMREQHSLIEDLRRELLIK